LSGIGAFEPNTQAALGLGTTYPDGGQVLDQLGILAALINEGPLTCDQVIISGSSGTGQLLRISLFHADGSELTPGTYQIGDPDAGSVAILYTLSRGPDAGGLPTASATSGTVNLSQIQPTTLATFEATMALPDGGGGELSGNLKATFCGVTYE
jgi:hypothetical protein